MFQGLFGRWRPLQALASCVCSVCIRLSLSILQNRVTIEATTNRSDHQLELDPEECLEGLSIVLCTSAIVDPTPWATIKAQFVPNVADSNARPGGPCFERYGAPIRDLSSGSGLRSSTNLCARLYLLFWRCFSGVVAVHHFGKGFSVPISLRIRSLSPFGHDRHKVLTSRPMTYKFTKHMA